MTAPLATQSSSAADGGTAARRAGTAWLLCAVLLFSTIEVVAKSMHPARPPLQIAFWRFFLAGLALLPAAMLSLRRGTAWLTATDWVAYAGLGVIGVTVGIGLYHAALARLPAAHAAILFSGHPVLVAVLAPAVTGERADRQHWVAVLAASAGMAGFLWDRGRLSMQAASGVALMLASMTAFALYTLLAKRVVGRHGALVLSSLTFLAGSLLLLPVTWTVDGAPWRVLATHHWIAIAYLALFATAAAYAAFFHGLDRAPATQASMVFFLKPVLAAALAALLLRERLGAAATVGGILIVGATAAALRRAPTGLP